MNRKNFISCSFSFAFTLFAFAGNNDTIVKRLMEQQAYFELNERLPSLEKETSELMLLQAKTTLYSYFNRLDEAIEVAQTILNKHAQQLDGQTWVNLTCQMANNYAQLGRYDYAQSIYNQVIEVIKPVADSLTMKYFTEPRNMYAALAKIPPMELFFSGNEKISYRRDSVGLIVTPVSFPLETIDFVIDYGASFCMVSDQDAEKMGITILEDSILTQITPTLTRFTKYGYAKELHLGNIVLKNVPFFVSTGDIIDKTITGKNYEIKGIIGLSVLRQFDQITYHKKGEITLASKSKNEKQRPNMILVVNRLFVKTSDSKDNLVFLFDSGMPKTNLRNRYYENHKTEVAKWTKDSIRIAGYAGIEESETFVKKNMEFQIGTRKVHFDSIHITVNDKYMNPIPIDGILGLDVLDKNTEMIINLKNMYMDFRK